MRFKVGDILVAIMDPNSLYRRWTVHEIDEVVGVVTVRYTPLSHSVTVDADDQTAYGKFLEYEIVVAELIFALPGE